LVELTETAACAIFIAVRFKKRRMMKKLERTIRVEILKFEELSRIEKDLIGLACHVRLNAQAPYSHYQVGCALITSGKAVSVGCNVENVNWSETGHAEENAINSAVAKVGIFRIAGMATVGAPEGQKVVWPPDKTSKQHFSLIKSVSDICPSCGHCLQKIAENCFDESGKFDPTIPLLGYRDETGEIYRTTIGDAYPMPFIPQHLGINYAKIIRKRKKHPPIKNCIMQ
jgi:cytidine deaminase